MVFDHGQIAITDHITAARSTPGQSMYLVTNSHLVRPVPGQFNYPAADSMTELGQAWGAGAHVFYKSCWMDRHIASVGAQRSAVVCCQASAILVFSAFCCQECLSPGSPSLTKHVFNSLPPPPTLSGTPPFLFFTRSYVSAFVLKMPYTYLTNCPPSPLPVRLGKQHGWLPSIRRKLSQHFVRRV